MLGSRQQGAFALETYFTNGRSMVAVQCAFCRHFNIPPVSRVPSDWKCVLMEMNAFQAMGNVSKEIKGPPKTVRTLEKVE
ncbi:hypothetical protein TNCV_1703191 [Trichonephila clavipes]|nr:hypothetical protein TNCV_1703191 [Trichonephila clavipes]